MDGLVIQLVIITICGFIAAAIANSKGRSVVGWFFGGFLLGIVGVIIVAVLPNLKAQREKEEYAERENRRLREQLRQERIKAESFRRHAQARLDTHDEHLGIDSRGAEARLTGPNDRNAGLLEGDSPGGGSTAHWYYEQSGQAIGPTTAEDIKQQLRGGTLAGQTLVWNESLGDWAPAHAVAEFRGDART